MSENKEARTIAGRSKAALRRGKTDGSRAGRLSLACLFWGILLFLPVCSGSAEKQTIPPGVEIRTQAHPKTAAIGDPIRIDLVITAPRGYTVEITKPEQQKGDFYILKFFPGPVIPDSDESGEHAQTYAGRNEDSQQHRARIVAAVYKTGTFTFPEIPVYVTDETGHKTGILSPSIDIEIHSILSGNDSALRDLKKQEDIPGKSPWLLWTVIAAAACVLGAASWYIRRKYRKTPPSMPSTPDRDPLELAEAELRDLIAGKLPENGRTKKFYVLLSEIVKRIVEAAYGIPASERTTIEIMDSLQRHPGIGRQIQETVQSLLLRCDIVKFAKYIPSKSENSNAAEDAFQVLAQAKEYKIGGSTSPAPGSRPGASGVESRSAAGSPEPADGGQRPAAQKPDSLEEGTN